MKTLIVCLGLALGGAQGQVKMQVFLSGKAAGTANLTQKLRPDGSKIVQMSMDIKSGDGLITLRSESIYLASGAPLRKFQEISVPAQKMRRTTIVEFSSKGAKVTLDSNGTRTSKDVPLQSGLPTADKSEFWFVRDTPKKGDVSTAYTFNIETLTWSAEKTTYEGEAEITVGGKKIKAHRTTTARGAAFMDATGLPLKLEVENGSMERIWH